MRGHEVPTVSALVVTYNSASDIDRCLRSVLAQDDGDQHVEVVVVDNASTDGTVERLHAYGDKVRVVANSVNVGFAGAMNQAASIASGEFLLLLNPDCVMDEECASTLWRHLATSPGVGLAAARLRNDDGSPQAFARRWPSAGSLFWTFTDVGVRLDRRFAGGRHASHREYRDEMVAMGAGEVLQVDCPAGACVMVPAALTRDRLLDPRLPLFFNDADLAWRLARRGYAAHVVGAATASHTGGATHRRVLRARRRAEFVASMRQFAALRWTSRRQLLLLLVLLLDAVVSSVLCLVPPTRRTAFANLRGVLGGLGVPKLGARPWLASVPRPHRQMIRMVRRWPRRLRPLLRGLSRRARRRWFLVRLRASAWIVGGRLDIHAARSIDVDRGVELEIRPRTRARIELGEHVRIQRGVALRIDDGSELDIGPLGELRRGVILNVKGHLRLAGRNVIGAGTNIHCEEDIAIGWGAMCSERVTIVDSTHVASGLVHPLDDAVRSAPIVIGGRCWLATNAVVGAGVTVGLATVVGANAVVTRDLPPGVMAVGAPAAPLRPLPHWYATEG